jgi:lipoate-protein ligase B
MKIVSLGLMPYADALEVMKNTHARVLEKACPGDGEILVVEHPPVVTLGNRPLEHDVLAARVELEKIGIDFFKTERGGSATVHEPGQCVVYPVVKLQGSKLGAKKFVWCLEEAMILFCASKGVVATRDPINAGVWVGNNKIGAIGIRVDRGVTMHGLALNICNTLSTFQFVTPCGLQGRGVTSLQIEAETLNHSHFREPNKVYGAFEAESLILAEKVLELVSREAHIPLAVEKELSSSH